jgi:methyl-accepting chemotaxis protein
LAKAFNLKKTAMKFKDFSIGGKITTGFLLISFIALVIGIVGFVGIRNVSTYFHNVADINMPSVEALQDIELALALVNEAHRTLLLPNLSPAQRDLQMKNIEEARRRQANAISKYEPLPKTAEELAKWSEFVQRRDQRRQMNIEIEALLTEIGRMDVIYPMELLKNLERFRGDHYNLQVRIANSIRNGTVFDDGDDHTACNLGRWAPSFSTRNQGINAALNALNEPHRQFHQSVADIKQHIRRGSRDEAWRIYEAQMMPAANRVFAQFDNAIAEAEKIVELTSQAMHKSMVEAAPIADAAVHTLIEARQISENYASQAVKDGDAAVSSSITVVIFGIVLGLVMAFILAVTISKMISAPLIKGVGIAEKISEGDLTVKIDNEINSRKDEIGQLGRALSNMTSKLKEVISSVVTGADNIASASEQMSSGSQQVSQGASEQASSAEEVSSSMEEMAANIQQNTDNAQHADKISVSVADGVQKVGTASKESLVSIKEIAEKIKIINDIAFQTNILALNAAVEAARAGEHGKGFAVVAAEVRKLAERSKIAADEIAILSTKSVNVTENASELMTKLIPEIEKTAKLVQEIAVASMEQTSGANQVNTAIQQLNEVTQLNAAASEEMATSAEELNSQAEQLKDVIGFFRIDNNAKKTSHAPAPLAQQNKFSAKTKTVPRPSMQQVKKTSGVSLNMDNDRIAAGTTDDKMFESF